jgi:hypothetical protein
MDNTPNCLRMLKFIIFKALMSGPKKILHLCPSLLIEFIGTYRCLPHMIELIVTGCRAREVILELLECCLLVKASKHFEELKIFRLSML